MPVYKIQDVRIERVAKGKGYNVAHVVYSDRTGNQKDKKIMDFSNPAVYATVKDLTPGTEVEVTLGDAAAFYAWTSVKVVGASAPEGVSGKPVVFGDKPATGKVLGSTYETPEERKLKQLLIVRQSSLSNAIDFAKAGGFGAEFTVGDMLETAQTFVDFVYQNDFSTEERQEELEA